jgi:protein-tyrosine phosphatase
MLVTPSRPEDVAPAGAARRRRRRGRLTPVLRNVLVGLVAFLVVGNLVITAFWQVQARRSPAVAGVAIAEVGNFREVDDRLWRGAAPSAASYRDLAAHGVTTVVDLRAEDYVRRDRTLLESLGIELVHLPVRDGQVPSDAQIATFLAAVESSRGPAFVHCGAGVGRTGAMVAAYLTAHGTTGLEALAHNLSVGPPSLEQIAFAARGASMQPPAAVVAASRVLDAPRRAWSRVRH